MEQLPREIDRCKRYEHALTAIICDIDFFKRINDTHGHSVGDVVLRLFAERIRNMKRTDVDWTVRYGGEEFVIILPETGFEGGVQAAEKFRSAIESAAFVTSAGELRISASFGVAAFDAADAGGELGVDELMRQADACLYRAKQNGRNRVEGPDDNGHADAR